MFLRKLAYSFLLLLVTCSLSAQKRERKDSLVRLLGCNILQQMEDQRGTNYRYAIGRVRFEHNSTLLVCDTALWNVNIGTIKATGNVRIIQNRTVLSSDNLTYFIDDNLAQFRGDVVQLQDKDKNTLRTKVLDYNTKDSVATFLRGGSFRDKDGQIIESEQGSYDAKTRLFSFKLNVNMFTDSIMVKTTTMDFNAGTSIATFGANTYAWKEGNMLAAQAGWYERALEKFTFVRDVHLMTESQEAWADTLVYYRNLGNADLSGNVELLDEGREVAAVAGHMEYVDSSKYIRMSRDPAVIAVTRQDDVRDTVYIGADILTYWTTPKCDVPYWEFDKSNARMELLKVDPVSEYRKKAAENARAAAEEAKKKMQQDDPASLGSLGSDTGKGAGGGKGAKGKGRLGPQLPAPWDEDPWSDYSPGFDYWFQLPDSLLSKQLPDSLASRQQPDSLASRPGSVQDTLSKAAPEEPKDSTRIGFLLGIRNVKVFRKDMQVSCDSLAYTDIDSLIRLYRSPIVWNEIRRQYSADSITVVLKNRNLDRASLMSNAFIIVQEDSICFDQIKGAEMMAYFDSTGVLSRFDAMGGSSGLFFIEEQETLATVNKFEAKMLTASFKDGNLNDLNYFEDVKSDAYPLVQLKREDRVLKGFDWQPGKRPKSPKDITSYVPRASERDKYSKVKTPYYTYTNIYFPGHLGNIVEKLDRQYQLKKERKAEQRRLENEMKAKEEVPGKDEGGDAPDDTLTRPKAAPSDTTVAGNTGKKGVLKPGKDPSQEMPGKDVAENEVSEKKDTLELNAAQIDSILAGNRIDALKSLVPTDPKEELRAKKKAEKEARKAASDSVRAERTAKKEAKWAALDAKDAEKAAVKAEKQMKKQRAKTLKMLKAKAKREAREQRLIDGYKARYEKQKARKDARKEGRKETRKKPN